MDNHTLFRIIAGVLFLTGLVTTSLHRTRARRERGAVSVGEEGSVIFSLLRLFGLAGWLSVVIYLINPRWMAWAAFAAPPALCWLGVALALSGMGIAFGAVRAIGTNVTATVATRADHQLVTSGPYRTIRHPLYTAGMLFFTGLGLMAANWFMLAAWLGVLIMLNIRLPREEAGLIAAFGDEYRAYMRRTGRFLPRLRPASHQGS